MISWTKKPKHHVEVAVEYYAPHWVVMIRNPVQKQWSALRDPSKKIQIQDEFGNEAKTRPAIKSFPSAKEANAWIKENLPDSVAVARGAQEVKQTLHAIENPQASNLMLAG